MKVVELKGKEKLKTRRLIRADIAEKAVKQIEDLIVELTANRLGREKTVKIAEASGKWTHDYPSTPKNLKS